VLDLEQQLRRVVAGDVRFDQSSRLLYATDASMYQMEPIGVVVPRHPDDVAAAVEVAKRNQVALLPRGGGTSLTGQTVNRALVLDFSRHLNQVLEINTEELWARVQPGLVQDELKSVSDINGQSRKPPPLLGVTGTRHPVTLAAPSPPPLYVQRGQRACQGTKGPLPVRVSSLRT
jgi:hypothetical protein